MRVGRWPSTAEDVADGINYVTGSCSGGACYAPQDALSSLVSGKTSSFGGITYSVGYNNRLLPSSISASSSNGTALSLAYSYYADGDVETVTNNLNSGRTITYGYDSLNRLNSASSQATSGTDCWGQSVPSGGYDVFGNLKTINVTKCSALSLSLSMNAKNEITNSGFGYNASGDETSDGVYSYTWDAEGRMTSGAGVTYTYDGDGERVKDSSPKLYWYGLNGRVLAETDTSGNTVNEYVYFAGARIARRDASGNVYYSFDKELDSATITTATGSVCYDADYYPFGGEVAFTNTCAQNYKFAGMEQDSASGLYRTMFREYSANYNRWLSPDPYRGSYDLSNPQSFNRYSYVMNNPTNFVDPFGLQQNCNLNGANNDGDVSCDNGGYSGPVYNTNFVLNVSANANPYGPPVPPSMYQAFIGDPNCPVGFACISVPGGPSGYAGPPAGTGGGGGAPNKPTCTTGFGLGLTAGADATAGLGYGAGANGSVGAGVFGGSNGLDAGAFASGGAGENFGSGASIPGANLIGRFFAGLVGGGGVGGFITNASQADQLQGLSGTWTVDFGSVINGAGQFSAGTDAAGNSIWSFSFTLGLGWGAGVQTLTNKTATAGFRGGC